MQLNPLGQESVALSAPIAIVQDDGWHVPPTSPAGAPLAFADVYVVGAHVVGGLQAFAPGTQVQLQQRAGADGAWHVQVEADRLVDVALAACVLAHAGDCGADRRARAGGGEL